MTRAQFEKCTKCTQKTLNPKPIKLLTAGRHEISYEILAVVLSSTMTPCNAGFVLAKVLRPKLRTEWVTLAFWGVHNSTIVVRFLYFWARMIDQSESRQMDICPAEACEEARHLLSHAGAS